MALYSASFGFNSSKIGFNLAVINLVFMNEQQYLNYKRISDAIESIQQNFTEQPNIKLFIIIYFSIACRACSLNPEHLVIIDEFSE